MQIKKYLSPGRVPLKKTFLVLEHFQMFTFSLDANESDFSPSAMLKRLQREGSGLINMLHLDYTHKISQSQNSYEFRNKN